MKITSTLSLASSVLILAGCQTETLTPSEGKQEGDNIFSQTTIWYINQRWSGNAAFDEGEVISKYNTGVWLNHIGDIESIPAGAIPNIPRLEDGISPDEDFGLREHLQDAEKQGHALVQLVLNNLPGRDCWAERSFGWLPNSNLGMTAYREHFIDRTAKILKEFPQIPIALILEPDTALYLSNQPIPEACKELDNTNVNGYVNGIRYAINTLSTLGNVHIYLDSGAASKFGWDDDLFLATLFTHGLLVGFSGLDEVARQIYDIETATGGGRQFDVGSLFIEPPRHSLGGTEPPGYDRISGFISNARDYVPLEEPFLGDARKPDGNSPLYSALFYDWNPRFGALEYAEDWLDAMNLLSNEAEHLGMLIDTSRNGWGQSYQTIQPNATIQDTDLVDQYRIDRRPHRGSWCNQGGAGLGKRPQATPDGKQWLHAYVWSKPPGESDGNSEGLFDGNFFDAPYINMCAPEGVNLAAEQWDITKDQNIATGALPSASFKDTWFSLAFKELLENAWPPICSVEGDSCSE